MEIIKAFQNKKEQYTGQIRDVIQVETEGYEWRKILQLACNYMHKNLSHYEWILLIDADAFYYSPVKGMSLLEFMDVLKKRGYNIINGRLFEFYPTEKDNPAITPPTERIKYYKVIDQWNQQKIFHYHPTIDFYTRTSGHVCYRDNPRVCGVIKFIYKHYPWTSYEHGLKKVFKERKPRYVERKDDPKRHVRWMAMRPIKEDFVKQSQKLRDFKEEKVLLSRHRFSWIMKFGFLSCLGNVFLHGRRYGLRLVIGGIKKLAYLVLPKAIYRKFNDFIAPFRFIENPLKAIIQRKPYALIFPRTYHFLMTNYCNAQCIFCNQKFNYQCKEEITLERFKDMISNIPVNSAKVLYFTGGGEPLLSRHLFPIIEYVNTRFPWIEMRIRTNGLLIEKYAEAIAKSNISRLEISVHGMTEINNLILQRKNTEALFRGISSLNRHLEDSNRKMYKLFYPAISRLNACEIPKLIKKAAELKVDEIAVFFCCYYPHNSHKTDSKLKVEDSLFFHKQLYNDIIQKSRKLAKSLGVSFRYEPLFFRKSEKKVCLQPWKVVVVNCDGNIYPCCGGEVQFDERVKSGEYYFGNLLKEHLQQCWNNKTYTMIRKTIGSNYKEEFIPECKICHNTLYFRKPESTKC